MLHSRHKREGKKTFCTLAGESVKSGGRQILARSNTTGFSCIRESLKCKRNVRQSYPYTIFFL